MRVLVQNCATKEFLKKDGHWIGSIEEAADFGSTVTAITTMVSNGLYDVQVVMKFTRPGMDIVTPLRSRHEMVI